MDRSDVHEGLKQIDGSKVEVGYAIEVRNAGRTRPSKVQITVSSDSRPPLTIPLKRFEERWYGTFVLVIDEAQLVQLTSNLTFVITWREGNTEREELLIKGLGSRATL